MNRIYNYPKLVVLIISIVTVFFAIQLPKMEVNNDLYIFLGENTPAKLENDAVEAVYGESEAMVVAVESFYESIISLAKLELIDSLTYAFGNVRHVSGVTSLTNADYIQGTDEGMAVVPLIDEEMKGSQVEIMRRLQSWDGVYRDNLYTTDLKSSQILLEIENDLALDTLEVVYKDVTALLGEFSRDDVNYHVAGVPAIAVELKEKMYADLFGLIPIVVVVVILSLWLSFRSFAGVALPLMTVLISSIWTIGLMAFMGVPLTMVGVGIPVILVSVGSAYGIHLMSHTYDGMNREKGVDFHDLVLLTVKKVGMPVLLAGLTTVAGFASLATSAIVPMREAGVFLAFGVLVAIMVALFMIPSILLLRKKPLRQVQFSDALEREHTLIDRFLLAFYDLFSKHNVRNLLIAAVILILAVIGTSRILIDTNMIGNFRENTPIARADAFQNDHFGGTTLISVVVDGRERGALLDPEVLMAMDELAQYLQEDVEFVGKVTSFTEFVKRMNQIMNRPEGNKVEAEVEVGEGSSFSYEDALGSGGGFSYEEDIADGASFSYEEDLGSEGGFSYEAAIGEGVEAGEDNIDEGNSVERAFASDDADLITLVEEAIALSGRYELSAGELLRELKRVTNRDGMAYYEIPYDPVKYSAEERAELKNLIAQYLLLYSGSLDGFIDDALEPSQSRMLVQITSPMNADATHVESRIMEFVDRRFPADYEVRISGTGKMAASVNDLVVSSQTSSIISSLLIVFAIIAISFRSIVAGFFGIVTLVFSLMINFGVMGFFGIKLDMGTSMVASVAIGIGIDYTIHFLSRYRLEARTSNEEHIIAQRTLLSAGKAILFNAVSVAAGFAVLIRSNFIPIENLGLLIALTMMTSSLGALTLLPAMIHTFKPKFINKYGGINV